MDRSALWLTFPPRYTNSFVWLYTWQAASTLNVAVDSGIPFARKHMSSVLASDTVRPNAAHTMHGNYLFILPPGELSRVKFTIYSSIVIVIITKYVFF